MGDITKTKGEGIDPLEQYAKEHKMDYDLAFDEVYKKGDMRQIKKMSDELKALAEEL